MKIKAKSQKQLKNNLRWHALLLLNDIEEGNFSHLVLNDFLQESSLSERDNRLLVQIVYGVIQHRYNLDYQLEPFIQGKKLEDWISILLRLSIFQLMYLDRVPSHAVVNEAVSIAKTNGHQGLGNLINGILRNVLRSSWRDYQEIEDDKTRLSVQYSVEPWIVGHLLEQLPMDRVESILQSLLETPKTSVRINPKKTHRDEMMDLLAQEGIIASPSQVSQDGLIIEAGDILSSQYFTDGYLTVQDESSMLVGQLGKIAGPESVLDACAAPGGKATHVASMLTEGHLTALDISASKMERVRENLSRMDLEETVTLKVEDALKFVPKKDLFYDRIFIDAPCSGLGLMRRKPEIKYDKDYQDILNLAEIQKGMLTHLSQFLKPNGQFIYSTCTLSREENEDVISHFIQENPVFHVDPIESHEGVPEDLLTEEGYVRIWPDSYGTDGFFISRLTKIRE